MAFHDIQSPVGGLGRFLISLS